MKPKFMLDTNICIYLMKHQPPQVRARFAECFVGDVVISAITLAELEFGVVSSGKAQERNQMIASHALSLGVTLVTNNEADFRGFAGLHVENWVTAS
ncbi:MAG: type II toxin-antitoxin system VapC family toxin [Betaproteobacteria bacterium]|nr:type II toxin-antitoxin system VapC family toxin [Betaproteobacteria bacterium]